MYNLCTRGVRPVYASHSENPSICWDFRITAQQRHPPRNARPNRSLRNGFEIPAPQLQPLVPPQVLHFMQVPFRTSV